MDELFDLFLAYIPTTNLVAPHMRFWPNGGGAIMAYTDKRQETERVVCEWTSTQHGLEIITALIQDPTTATNIDQAAAPGIPKYAYVEGPPLRASESVPLSSLEFDYEPLERSMLEKSASFSYSYGNTKSPRVVDNTTKRVLSYDELVDRLRSGE